MTVDHGLQLILDQAAGAPVQMHEMPIEQLRSMMSTMATFEPAGPEMAAVSDLGVPGPAGDVPVRVYVPGATESAPVLVWMHGGGFVAGSLDTEDANLRKIAAGVGCVVVSIDYRLSPEAVAPAALHDCEAVIDWLRRSPHDLPVDRGRIAIGGSSAGGNLAAVLARHAAERGEPAYVHQLLLYPVTDLAARTHSIDKLGEGYLLTAAALRLFTHSYLGNEGDETDPDVSPLRAELRGDIAPATIITAEYDPLRDEGEEYAARLRTAGVDATATRVPGAIHGFVGMSRATSLADVGIGLMVTALAQAFAQ